VHHEGCRPIQKRARPHHENAANEAISTVAVVVTAPNTAGGSDDEVQWVEEVDLKEKLRRRHVKAIGEGREIDLTKLTDSGTDATIGVEIDE